MFHKGGAPVDALHRCVKFLTLLGFEIDPCLDGTGTYWVILIGTKKQVKGKLDKNQIKSLARACRHFTTNAPNVPRPRRREKGIPAFGNKMGSNQPNKGK